MYKYKIVIKNYIEIEKRKITQEIYDQTVDFDKLNSNGLNSNGLNSNGLINYINMIDELYKNWVLNYIADSFKKEVLEYISFELTVGEINRISYGIEYIDHIELYLVPIKNDTDVFEEIYKKRVKIPNLMINKYASYNEKINVFTEIKYNNIIIKYSDIHIQTCNGLNDKGKHVFHLILRFNNKLAKKILVKKEIKFENSSRTVWYPINAGLIELIITNIIGQYNFINNIGYIELLPKKDCDETVVFDELISLQDHIKIIEKTDNILKCNTCNRKEYQLPLHRCSKCKKNYYCSTICQMIDFDTHSNIC
jgi:hypothetical protein